MTKNKKAKAEILTPIYSILYKKTAESLSFNYGSRGLGSKDYTPTYTKVGAIRIAKRLEKKNGYLVQVYQYGWKQRGFRSNERQCEVVYSSINY